MKKCQNCEKDKPFESYHLNKNSHDGRDPRCKECRKTKAAQRYRDNWFKATYTLKKSWCKKNNIAFDLTPDYLESIYTETCPVSGVKFERHNKKSSNSPALDRIRPDKGYVKGNVVFISARQNRIKYDATLDELKRLVRWLEGATTIRNRSTPK